ncbi:unnamed protein product [Aureobasidium pullulans]|nr:unnamed protein product [Aureobasidium pullulans]
MKFTSIFSFVVLLTAGANAMPTANDALKTRSAILEREAAPKVKSTTRPTRSAKAISTMPPTRSAKPLLKATSTTQLTRSVRLLLRVLSTMPPTRSVRAIFTMVLRRDAIPHLLFEVAQRDVLKEG